MRNELPLILPITPAESPQKNMRTRKLAIVLLQQPVERPEHADDSGDRNDRPRHGCDDADHDLEQPVGGDHETADRHDPAAEALECPAAALLDVLAHASIVA